MAISTRASASGRSPLSGRPQTIALAPVAIPPGSSTSPVSVGVKLRIVWVKSGKMKMPP